jgi:hypothetical protein
MVGKIGQFTDSNGVVRQCIVTGMDIPPWDDVCLVIDYVRDGQKITGAMIPTSSFEPDLEPL